MKEIKFRAWDKETKAMTQPFSFKDVTGEDGHEGYIAAGDTEISPWEIGERFTLMQYTGHHDKNGKEIASGDIAVIKPNFHVSEPHVVVHWDEQNLAWSFGCHTFVVDGALDDIEIIGNIYENPELLEV